MKRPSLCLSASVLALTLVLTSVAEASNPAGITLMSGHSIVIETPALQRVAVGDGRIASVVPVGSSQVVVSGKAPGRTSVIVWSGGASRSYEVQVTEEVLDSIASMLRASLNEPDVSIVDFDHAIVVRGTVEDGQRFARLSEVLGRFEKLETAQKYSVVNAVTIAHPLGDLQASLVRVLGQNDVKVDPDAKGNVIVSGHVNDRVRAQWVLEQVRGLAGGYLTADGKVIDRLNVATISQIDVKVRIYEVDKTALSQLGVSLQAGTPNPSIPGSVTIGPPSFTLLETATGIGKALTLGAFFRTTLLAPTLDLLVTNGDAKLLSEPDLVTLPGLEATFLVGGEIPIPQSTGLGAVSVVYKEYGVRLKFTPQILGDGSVMTKLEPEVSDLDFQDGVSINGFVIPALKTSRVSTSVVTGNGESIVVGGMLRRIEQRNVQKIPLLGDLPILGKLFRSTRYQTSQTDVIFVMTPQILTRV
jgi:Flp pilus assembly secretin CpaC